MLAEDFPKNCKVVVRKECFAIVKCRKSPSNAFAVIQDGREITVIIEQSKIQSEIGEDAIEIERGWKILTFDMTLPFELVGFLAKVSGALAEEGISIFVVSSYSTDHVLVREEDVEKAIRKLEELGCVVVRERRGI
jgi:hypothetical protein